MSSRLGPRSPDENKVDVYGRKLLVAVEEAIQLIDACGDLLQAPAGLVMRKFQGGSDISLQSSPQRA